MGLDAAEVMTYLRTRGIEVLHTTTDWQDPARVVVFLSRPVGEPSDAEVLAAQIPGVQRVGFSPDTRAIMYVTGTP